MTSAKMKDLFKRLKGETFFRSAGVIAICISAAMILVSLLSTEVTAQETIVLKGVTAFPRSAAENESIPPLRDLVQRKSGGQLKINWLGGPEVIKSFDQGEALRKGTVDMILFTPVGYFTTFSPIFQAKGLSAYTGWEERAIGAFDLWVKVFREKVNAEYLGAMQWGLKFHIFSNRKITKIGDFKGMKIRVSPLYIPFVKALGAAPITIPPPDIYTSMQRGVVDGFVWINTGIPTWGWHEVTKYMVSPGFFQMEDATMANLDKFNSLPKNLQKALKDSTEIMEGIGSYMSLLRNKEEWNVMRSAGMEEINLPPEDAKKFLDLAYQATWKVILEQDPVYGPQFQKLISKK